MMGRLPGEEPGEKREPLPLRTRKRLEGWLLPKPPAVPKAMRLLEPLAVRVGVEEVVDSSSKSRMLSW